MSENKPLNIYQKLLELQKSIDVLKKDKSGQGYKYASGENILKVIRPKMDILGLLLFQETVSSETEHVIWHLKGFDKQQTFVHLRFKFTWVDVDSEKTISHFFEADGFNDWDKAIGSAMTYGERYYLLKTFHIATDELNPEQRANNEDIKTKAKENAEKLKDNKKLTPLEELVELGKTKKVKWNEVIERNKVGGLSKLTEEQVKSEIKILKEMK